MTTHVLVRRDLPYPAQGRLSAPAEGDVDFHHLHQRQEETITGKVKRKISELLRLGGTKAVLVL